jgi:uncharacterized protein YjiK
VSSSDESRLLDPDEAIEPPLDKREKKRLKKLQKALEQARRPLDSWERYRALSDAFDMEQDLVDLADNKARFALLIMGTLNAVTFIIGTRPEALALVPVPLRTWLSIYIGLYALLALYFFIQAIESLRPREAKPAIRYRGEAGLQDFPMGVRFYADVLQRDVSAYRAVWRSIHIGQLNAEVSMQVHALARINKAKYRALERLYIGLKGMTLLTACFITVFALLALTNTSEGMALLQAKKGGKGFPKAAKAAPKHPAALLGLPTRFTDVGAREPSGVSFHAKLGHLFLVGDEGSVVELDKDAKVLKTHPVKGNLEDLAVHTPSGNLLLLAEKKSELIFYDTIAGQELRRWTMSRADLLGQEPGDKNSGFEGLAFRADAKLQGGGIFYLVHQRMPEMVVGLTIDIAEPSGPLKAEVIHRWPLTEKNTKAAAYVASLDRLFVLSGKTGLTVLKMDGRVEADIPVGGDQPEGMCFDGDGNLWIAEDRGKALLRFSGALQSLTEHLKSIQPGPQAGNEK